MYSFPAPQIGVRKLTRGQITSYERFDGPPPRPRRAFETKRVVRHVHVHVHVPCPFHRPIPNACSKNQAVYLLRVCKRIIMQG
jgi:hypothetical protein